MVFRTVYLAGPISVADYAGATGWYEEASLMLDSRFELLRPMRGKEFLEGRAGKIGHHAHPHVLATNQAILGRDFDDLRRSDVVLMNLTGSPDDKSIGCSMEAAWCFALRKILILIAPQGNAHEGHVMLEGAATYRCQTLEGGCEVANSLLPGAEWESGRHEDPLPPGWNSAFGTPEVWEALAASGPGQPVRVTKGGSQ